MDRRNILDNHLQKNESHLVNEVLSHLQCCNDRNDESKHNSCTCKVCNTELCNECEIHHYNDSDERNILSSLHHVTFGGCSECRFENDNEIFCDRCQYEEKRIRDGFEDIYGIYCNFCYKRSVLTHKIKFINSPSTNQSSFSNLYFGLFK